MKCSGALENRILVDFSTSTYGPRPGFWVKKLVLILQLPCDACTGSVQYSVWAWVNNGCFFQLMKTVVDSLPLICLHISTFPHTSLCFYAFFYCTPDPIWSFYSCVNPPSGFSVSPHKATHGHPSFFPNSFATFPNPPSPSFCHSPIQCLKYLCIYHSDSVFLLLFLPPFLQCFQWHMILLPSLSSTVSLKAVIHSFFCFTIGQAVKVTACMNGFATHAALWYLHWIHDDSMSFQ